jgi:hypothetical protein
MSLEKEELKKELLRAYEKKLDKALNEGYGQTLRDMEVEVLEIKNAVGKAVLEAKLGLKKNKERGGV